MYNCCHLQLYTTYILSLVFFASTLQ